MIKRILSRIEKPMRKQAKAIFDDLMFSYHIPRFALLLQCMELIHGVPGAIVEAGVRGGTSFAMLRIIVDRISFEQRDIIGFDSFEGFPEGYILNGVPYIKKKQMDGDELLSMVERRLGYCSSRSKSGGNNVKLVKGYFTDTLKDYDSGPIAFIHADVDLGQSYLEVLEYLYPHVARGGIILFDEYDSKLVQSKFPEVKPAIDTYLEGKEYDTIKPEYFDKLIIRKMG